MKIHVVNGGGSYKVRWVGGNLHAGLAATQNVNINGGVQQREYSIEATVTSDPTVTGDGCATGWPIVNRRGPDSNGWTMASPDQKFTCSGQVTAWKYQGKFSRPFRAIVFRPTGGAVTEFEIVGINDIPAGAVNTPVNYVVPESDRITVAIGDVIGWSFGGGVITYNGGGSYKVRWVGGNLHAGLAATQNVNINGGVQQREYSIEATVTSDPTVTGNTLILIRYCCGHKPRT
ncbi:uncharacterized protein [Amphiura filiformis]|uniref:uncharacterized protein n=1 Tax=Amphiura filiformis TaxID=82378 RepID=UPI003B215183